MSLSLNSMMTPFHLAAGIAYSLQKDIERSFYEFISRRGEWIADLPADVSPAQIGLKYIQVHDSLTLKERNIIQDISSNYPAISMDIEQRYGKFDSFSKRLQQAIIDFIYICALLEHEKVFKSKKCKAFLEITSKFEIKSSL